MPQILDTGVHIMHIQLVTQYPENHALAVLIGDGDAMSTGAEKLNTISSGYILGSLKKLGFKSAKGKVQILSALPDQPYTALAVLAAGDLAGLKEADVESVVASLYHATKSAGF
ncbi:MAG: hypothetical protein B7Z26_10005, partial [Asticcacaulis sp. 32-58-5]